MQTDKAFSILRLSFSLNKYKIIVLMSTPKTDQKCSLIGELHPFLDLSMTLNTISYREPQ